MDKTGVLHDIGFLARCLSVGSQGEIHPMYDSAIAYENGRIVWVGSQSELPAEYASLEHHSAAGRMVTPGLVDCHTHLAFGGWRADEFRMRIEGKGYLEIAAAGGGIRRTVMQTRAAAPHDLESHCLTYLERYLQLGVTSVECKTGYGLSFNDELKILRVYAAISSQTPIDIVSTLLAAHIVPPDEKCNNECYINMICKELIPAVVAEGLAEFNDVFVEKGAFSSGEALRILRAGSEHGLIPKLHVDQLADGGGGVLAAEIGAVSADHLEFTSAEGMQAMAGADVTAVCLPFASLYLNQPPMNSRSFIDAGVNVAVATDFNPGSAPSYDLPLAMMLACTMSRMTPAEVLKSVTIRAAGAINRDTEYGSIEPGKRANFVELSVPDIDHWMYHFQPNACKRTWINGTCVYDAFKTTEPTWST